MNQLIINTGILAVVFLFLFTTAEIAYHKYKVKTELTRKYVHLATGLLTLMFPQMIENHWLVLFLCASFLAILILSLKLNKLPSINAVKRKTVGSLLYPFIVYGCFLIYRHYDEFVFYYIPILILAICDPIAGLSGKTWPIGKYNIFGKTKTLLGSGAFLISSFLTSFILLMSVSKAPLFEALLLSVIISLITTVAEAFSHGGYDNLTIPGTTVLILLAGKEYFTFF